MAEESIIAVYGAITGSVGLALVIYKTWIERPRFYFEIEKTVWRPPYKDEHNHEINYIVFIDTLLRNKVIVVPQFIKSAYHSIIMASLIH